MLRFIQYVVIKMELTLDQALQKGVEAHKAGKAQEADRYYTAILEVNYSTSTEIGTKNYRRHW